MDAVIPDVDSGAYEVLCARAIIEGRTESELINDAIRAHLARPVPGRRSLRELISEPLPNGNDNLSSELDGIVYDAD